MTPRVSHLFVVTYGRSGSTLLTGWLNRLPGVRIWGENNGALIPLWRFVRQLENARPKAGNKPADAPTHPWFGVDAINPAEARRDVADLAARHLLRRPPGIGIVGFKEIRHGPAVIDDLDDYLGFLFETFESAGVIFHHRAVAATARSKWWAGDPDAARLIAATRARFLASRFAEDPRILHTDYDRFIAGPDEAARVARFLGLPFDAGPWRETLTTRHSY